MKFAWSKSGSYRPSPSRAQTALRASNWSWQSRDFSSRAVAASPLHRVRSATLLSLMQIAVAVEYSSVTSPPQAVSWAWAVAVQYPPAALALVASRTAAPKRPAIGMVVLLVMVHSPFSRGGRAARDREECRREAVSAAWNGCAMAARPDPTKRL